MCLGFFNLDPNRVLDILLEAFECRVEEDLSYVPLVVSYLSHCDVSGLAQLMGFKYQFYHVSCFNFIMMISKNVIKALLGLIYFLLNNVIASTECVDVFKVASNDYCFKKDLCAFSTKLM